MTISNAREARELAKSSDHHRLKETLELIEYWASNGLYGGTVENIPDQLANNLRSKGFTVNQETGSISW